MCAPGPFVPAGTRTPAGTARRVAGCPLASTPIPAHRVARRAVPIGHTVAAPVALPFVADRKGATMPRRTPATLAAVLALGDARLRIAQLLDRDGIDAHDREALLLLDTAAYWMQRADLGRRERHSIEDHGEIVPRLLRERRELEDEYRHLAPAWRDAA